MLEKLTTKSIIRRFLWHLSNLKNVNKYYGDYHALRDINLEIEKDKLWFSWDLLGLGNLPLSVQSMPWNQSITGTLIVNGHN